MSEDHAKEKNAIVVRIIKAITDIALFAGELAECASEELGTAISKRDVLEAITDIIMQADATGASVEDLLLDACTSFEKKQEAANAD